MGGLCAVVTASFAQSELQINLQQAKRWEDVKMKVAWIVAVLLCVAMVSAASAQLLGQATGVSGLTARQIGMGGVGVGIADDSAAWFQNPAGLGALSSSCPKGKTWANDVSATYGKGGDEKAYGISWSGWDPAKALGAGAGWLHMTDGDSTNAWGAGFGMEINKSPFSAGVNFLHTEDDTYIDLGLMYRFARPNAAPVRAGLLVEDITGKTDEGPFFDLGVAWPVTPKLLLSADALDVTGKTADGPFFNVGGEYVLGAKNEWRLRAGLVDNGSGHDVSLGAGYVFANNWRLDAAWVNTDPDSMWAATVSTDF